MKRPADTSYQQIPQLDECLRSSEGRELLARYARPLVISAMRSALAAVRNAIRDEQHSYANRGEVINSVLDMSREFLLNVQRKALQPVINATGVLLQTNLGRAPLSESAVEALSQAGRGYCNLEYDLESGGRGRRGAYIEDLLLRVLECDAETTGALVVNNCAAATLLALNSLADGGEVIVSRGELVEIGGGFRVPDILRKSGARLVEVGTTNRTRIEDYAVAITAETRLILRVHRSNFQIVGFTAQPGLHELVKLGCDAGVAVFEDQGTGCILDLQEFGIGAQSSFSASVRSSATLVSASGDKLLGGPQCGLVVGKLNSIQRLRENPLYRALRVDKLTYAALQATLSAYLAGEAQSIPVVAMLGLSAEIIRQRCERIWSALAAAGVSADVVATESVVGGGTTPGATLPSFAVALNSVAAIADEVAARLRRVNPPVIARIREGRVLLDLRTVPAETDERLTSLLLSLGLSEGPGAGEEPGRE